MVVPVSQLVLPVGVTGLMVKGKTPTPEPGSIVGTAAIVRRTHTEGYVRVRKHSLMSHTNTQRMESVRVTCTWISLVFVSLQAASQGTQSFHVTTKSSSAGQTLTREPSHILIGKMLTVEHPNWPNSKVTAKAGKRVRLQCQTTEREKISPLHVYGRFNPHNLEISYY